MNIEYKVISSGDMGVLVASVNLNIKQGWALQGGVSVSESMSQGYTNQLYAQAMIKETK
jgi:hypothetical protein